jgi:hypothetical protein
MISIFRAAVARDAAPFCENAEKRESHPKDKGRCQAGKFSKGRR